MKTLRTKLAEMSPLGEMINEYAFVIRGEYRVGKGESKLSALLAMGLSKEEAMDPAVVSKHGTVFEAQNEGWDAPPVPAQDPEEVKTPRKKWNVQQILMGSDDEPAPVKEGPGGGQDIETFG